MEKGKCTCHPDGGLPIHREDPQEEWAHEDDTYAETAHVHISRYGRDCDGGHGQEYVMLPKEGQDKDDMWSDAVRLAVYAHAVVGKLEIVNDETARVSRRFSWREETEEGYRCEEGVYCTTPWCAYDKSSNYDQYAEMAGY